MPFTNARGEGFENKLAGLIGRELDADIEYTWRPQRRGFHRTLFKEGDCDLVLGVPAGFDPLLTTKAYYRSSYAFISRRERGLAVDSLDDDALRRLKVGVQLIGDDGVNTLPAHALAARGLVDNVVGYTVYGDYAEECPPARIIDAVRRGDVDIAVAWGPLAGYFARKSGVGLTLTPIEARPDPSGLPFAFDICVGVRRGREELRDEVDGALARRRDDIRAILQKYGVPRVPTGPAAE